MNIKSLINIYLGKQDTNIITYSQERRQRKQVCGSEGTVVGRAGTLLLCALAIILFCLFIGLVSLWHGLSSACA